MAITFGFYNSVNHDRRYDAVQWGQIFDGIIKDGVYETYKKAFICKASATPNNKIIVQPGRAWFNHTWTYNDADLSFEVLQSEVVLDRIDALVIDINSDLSKRENKLMWIKGTPSSGAPVKPTNFDRTATHNQYPIAYVYRHSDNEVVKQDDIENAVGTSLCPFVTGIIKGISTDDLLMQWSAQFQTYLVEKKNEVDNWKKAQQDAFFNWAEDRRSFFEKYLSDNNTAWNNWFTHIQTQLDGDTAGHLQQQIDALKYFYVQDETMFLPMTAASVADETLIMNGFNT